MFENNVGHSNTSQPVVLDVLDRVQRAGEPAVLFPSPHVTDLEVLVRQIQERGLRMAAVPLGCITALPPIPLDAAELSTVCHMYCNATSDEARAEQRRQIYLRDYPLFRVVEERCTPLYHPADVVIKIAQLCYSIKTSTSLERDLQASPFLHISPVHEICLAIRNGESASLSVPFLPYERQAGALGDVGTPATLDTLSPTSSSIGPQALETVRGGENRSTGPQSLAVLPTTSVEVPRLFHSDAFEGFGEDENRDDLTGQEVVDNVGQRTSEYLEASDYHLVTNSSIFYDGEGDDKRVVAIYLTNAISGEMCRNAAQAVEPAANKNNLRAATNGGQPPDTGIVGYYDYLNNPSQRKCRETEFTRNNWPSVMEGTAGFLKAVDELYRECAPIHHSLQHAAIPTEYQLHGTVFSTVTVNRNFRTAVHTDRGDFRSGLGALCVVNGKFEGCHLVIKRLGRAFRMQVGDVLLFDTSLEHGNTAILSPHGSWSRTSVVCYLRNGLMSSVCEMERRRDLNRRVMAAIDRDDMTGSTVNLNCVNAALPPLYVPVSLVPKLAPVQLAALSFVMERLHKGSGSVVAMNMGLGKTLVALTLCYSYMHTHPTRDLLILTPKAVIGHWAAEHHKWGGSGLRFHYFVHSDGLGTSAFDESLLRYEQQLSGLTARTGHLFVLNPEYALSFLRRFRKFDPALVIVDEGHRVANKGSKLSEALDKLNCRLRVVLTGTPVQNTAEELYNLVSWVNAAVSQVMPASRFHDLANSIDRYVGGEDEALPDAIESQKYILDWMRGFVFREMENDLPPLHDYLIVCGSSARQQALAEQVGIGIGAASAPLSASEFRPYHIATHPICYLSYTAGCYLSMCAVKAKRDSRDDPELGGGHRKLQQTDLAQVEHCYALIQQNRVDSFIAMSGKLSVLAEILKRVKQRNEKAIVFSQYVGSQDLIHRTLTALQILTFTIRGRDSQDRRRQALTQFFTDPDLVVLVLSTKIAAYGLDFTAANHVIMFDAWWNPQVESQAIARAYRRNQTKPVTVYRLASEIEDQYVLKAQMRKLALFQCIMHDKTTRCAHPDEICDCAESDEDEERRSLWRTLKAQQLDGGTTALLHVYKYGDAIRGDE